MKVAAGGFTYASRMTGQVGFGTINDDDGLSVCESV